MLVKLMRYLTRRQVRIDFGSLVSVRPVSTVFGLDRGTPINRYYIERFLAERTQMIRGKVLEVGNSEYSRRFGGNRVECCDILHATTENPAVTIVGNLADPTTLPADAFDCFICTQTFDCIFDLPQAVAGAHHLLKPGGVLLATVSGIGQISRYDMERWGEFWRFTTASVARLFEPVFSGGVEVASYGNVVAAIALLQGIALEELPNLELLDANDPDYQVIITIVARKDRA